MQACRALGLRFRVWLGFTSHSDTSHAPSSADLATHKETDYASTSKGDIIAQCSRWLGRLLSSSGVQVLKHIPSLSAMSQSLHRTCGTSKHPLAWQHCGIQCRLHSTAPLRILTGSEEDMEPLKPWVHLQRDPSRLVIFGRLRNDQAAGSCLSLFAPSAPRPDFPGLRCLGPRRIGLEGPCPVRSSARVCGQSYKLAPS